MNKLLGKITNVSLGFAGYQGVEFGLTLEMEFGDTWCQKFQGDFKDLTFKNDRLLLHIQKLLLDSKKQEIKELKGVPVEGTFKNDCLVDFRVLTEVIL